MKPNLNKFFLFSFLLASCAVATPAAVPTLAVTPTLISTSTPLPTSTATFTPELPGTIAGVNTLEIGFDVGELVLNDKGEIVYAATGEVAGTKVKGKMRFIYNDLLKEHIHKVVELGEMRNGEMYYDEATWDRHFSLGLEINRSVGIKCQIGTDKLKIDKPSGYIDSYTLAVWIVGNPGEDLRNKDPHNVAMWIQPKDYEGNVNGPLKEFIKGFIKLPVTNWINPTRY